MCCSRLLPRRVGELRGAALQRLGCHSVWQSCSALLLPAAQRGPQGSGDAAALDRSRQLCRPTAPPTLRACHPGPLALPAPSPRAAATPPAEEEARWFFQQLTVGLAYLHSIGVDNRELNLSNKLLTGDEARPLLKINDFTYRWVAGAVGGGRGAQHSCPTRFCLHDPTLHVDPAYARPSPPRHGSKSQGDGYQFKSRARLATLLAPGH